MHVYSRTTDKMFKRGERVLETYFIAFKSDQLENVIIIIYSFKIGAGQQDRICGTYNCPQYKIKCRNIKYKRITENNSQHSNSANGCKCLCVLLSHRVSIVARKLTVVELV